MHGSRRNLYHILAEKCESRRTIWRLHYGREENNSDFALKCCRTGCNISGCGPVAGFFERCKDIPMSI